MGTMLRYMRRFFFWHFKIFYLVAGAYTPVAITSMRRWRKCDLLRDGGPGSDGCSGWKSRWNGKIFVGFLTFIRCLQGDKLSWALGGSGQFSTNSLYHKGAAVAHFKQVWKTKFPPRIRVFLWQLLRGRLPAGDHLAKRKGL
jgi:hypothetical protein